MKQLSTEWAHARRGKITASRFGDVLASPETKRYQGYLQEVVDGLRGVPDFDDWEKPWFRHGRQWEDAARGEYEWSRDVSVIQVGFLTHPKYDFIGCSPDGLVEKSWDKGGVEIKAHKSRPAFDKVGENLPAQHKPQVQGCLWITGRDWWDFFSFYQDQNERVSKRLQITPDKDYINMLEQMCLRFWVEVQEQL